MNQNVQIQFTNEAIDVKTCLDFISVDEAGGQCVFIGNVRDENNDKKVIALEYEGYDTMAKKEMLKIAMEAMEEWPLSRVVVHHRAGTLSIGEAAVVIGVSAKHRKEAFLACEFIIDTLKQRVPIWKKEIYADGKEWLSAHP